MDFYDIATLALIPLIILTLIAGVNVRRTFSKYKKLYASSGITAAQAARLILERSGAGDVMIKTCRGSLTDHYDPGNNTVYLSESVYASCSVASIGIAAHEAGHAIQYARNYAPIRLRGAIVPIVNFASKASLIFIIAALIFFEATAYSQPMLIIGICFYAVYTLFTIITLPVELDASRRAKQLLVASGILTPDENLISSKVLNAAAMTYVASMALSILQLLRFIGLLSRRR
ncbi:MAG: zinc metallopeptidase [Clostridiales bacterium]|jgi:Zn-dependent membrane protease YugP|nr:zinc metallopeptidase [Clostridiales bacterium]